MSLDVEEIFLVFRRECRMQQNVKDRESEMNFYQKHVVLVNTWPVVNGRGGGRESFLRHGKRFV